MPKSEDKLALEILQCEINVLYDTIQMLEQRVETYNAKLQVLLDRKKSMENYLNNDNN